MTFTAIIVVYNSYIGESLTYNSLKDSGVQMIICDNSTRDMGNEAFCRDKKELTYINMGGNAGLPKAYNAAIRTIEKKKDHFVCILDDDTGLPEDYFVRAEAFIASSEKEDLFVPVIEDGTGILSPCIMRGNFIHRVKDLGELGEDFGAINSGMIIRSTVYEQLDYDENMFLDFVDFAFVRRAKAAGYKMGIMKDILLHQTFSANVDSREKAEVRFKILKKDLKYYYKDSPLYYFYVITKRKLRLCVKFRTLHFLHV